MRTVLAPAVFAAAATASSPPGPAEPAGSPTPSLRSRPFADWDHATGDLFALRPRLAELGLSIGGTYTAEFTSILEGGLHQRGSFRNLLTIDAEFDPEPLLGIRGGTLFIQYLSVNPESGGSRDAGDLQVFSNIENDFHIDAIYELWYEQSLFDDLIRLKLGKIDANTEFAFVEAAGDFANSSAGFSPTIFAFPSFPDSATSINIFARVFRSATGDLTIGYGLYDGAAAADGVRTGNRGPSTFFNDNRSDDSFHIAHAEWSWARSEPDRSWFRSGRIAGGAWLHTGEFERFDGASQDSPHGFFLTAESSLYTIGDPEAGRAVHIFVQYGWADEEVSEVAQHLAAGFVLQGPLAQRPDDRAGIYASLADLSDDPAAGFEADEFTLDAYYRLQLTPAIFIQPEVQLIVNPSGDPSIDDALVGGLRIGVEF